MNGKLTLFPCNVSIFTSNLNDNDIPYSNISSSTRQLYYSLIQFQLAYNCTLQNSYQHTSEFWFCHQNSIHILIPTEVFIQDRICRKLFFQFGFNMHSIRGKWTFIVTWDNECKYYICHFPQKWRQDIALLSLYNCISHLIWWI